MNNRQLDEAAILEVAREIKNGAIRAKYLSQVCDDPEVRLKLEQRAKVRRRWQFGLRSLFVLMIVAAVMSTFLGITANRALEARRLEENMRRQTMMAAERARAAALQAQPARAATIEENVP